MKQNESQLTFFTFALINLLDLPTISNVAVENVTIIIIIVFIEKLWESERTKDMWK